MSALQTVFQTYGLPIALYTDRAGWAFYTPTAGGKVDLSRPTQLGRALIRLGIEHIPSYSPQGRGRGERLNRTLQGRLINELRVAGITTVEAANAYLREQFIADYDAQFTCPPADPDPAFVALGTVDLDLILCQEEERTVGLDNVVVLEGVALQLSQAARPAHLRAPARDRPPPPRWHPLRLARPAVLGPLRRHRHPPHGVHASAADSRPRSPPHGAAPTARPFSRAPFPPAHASSSRPSLADGPPGLSGQITCQNQADISLVNNTGTWPGQIRARAAQGRYSRPDGAILRCARSFPDHGGIVQRGDQAQPTPPCEHSRTSIANARCINGHGARSSGGLGPTPLGDVVVVGPDGVTTDSRRHA